MKRFEHVAAVSLGMAVWGLGPRWASAADSCPSATDIPYSTQSGETWFSLGGRAYCLDGSGDRSRAAIALYEYNRGRVGLTPGDLPQGVTVCLPQYLHGEFFDAERCRSAPVPAGTQPDPPPSPPPPKIVEAICGNGVRELGESCDGIDLAGSSCSALNLPAGSLVCRADCRGFDASGCAPPPAPDHVDPLPNHLTSKRADEPDKSVPLSLSAELSGGVLFPLSDEQRDGFYDVLGLSRAGLRFGVGPVEVALHGLVGGRADAMSSLESQTSWTILGGGIQVGVPFSVGALQFTPGIEAMGAKLARTMVLPDVYKQKPHTDPQSISFVGAFLRSTYSFRRLPRLAVSVEISVDFVPQQVASFAVSENFQMKTLGGLSYAAF